MKQDPRDPAPIYVIHRSILSFWPGALVCVIVLVLLGVFEPPFKVIAHGIYGACTLWAFTVAWRILSTEYRVYPHFLQERTGLPGIPLRTVSTPRGVWAAAELQQTLAGKLLGYGTLSLVSVSTYETPMSMQDIPGAAKLKAILKREHYAAKRATSRPANINPRR